MQIMLSISIEANNSDKKLSILIKPISNRIHDFVINVLNYQHFHAVYIICMQPVPDNSQTFTNLYSHT